MRTRDATGHVLVFADSDPSQAIRGEHAKLAAGFAAAAAGGLAQLRLVEEQAARTAQQAALARAAKTLNETLDIPAVLGSICSEACTIFGGDMAAAYIGERDSALIMESSVGLAERYIGLSIAPGEGLAGRVALADQAMLTNDYQRIARPRTDSPFTKVQSCMGVPMRWDGALRGVLSIGFTCARFLTAQDLALLETFGEIAGAACRNASTAAGLALAARTDGLTGCLNHAALQEALTREIQRAERSAQDLSVILLDLDDSSRSTSARAIWSATRSCAAPARRCGSPRGPTTSSRVTAATSSRSSRSTPTRTPPSSSPRVRSSVSVWR